MGQETLKYSPAYDVRKSALIDTVEEHVVRCYPYIMPNLYKTQAFIQQNTTSIVYVSQNPYKIETDEDLRFLKTDENGNLYFEIAAFITKDGELQLASSTSAYGMTYFESETFIGVTDDYVNNFKEDGKLFTFNKPLDPELFKKGKQDVFLASSIASSEPATIEDVKEAGIDSESLTEISFVNIKTIEQMYSNSRIELSFVDTLPLLENASQIDVELSNMGLLNFIKGKALSGLENEEAIIDVDIESKSKLSPWKFSPIDIDEKLTMYNDWADNQMVMFKAFYDMFRSTDSKFEPKALTTLVPNSEARELIEDCIAIDIAFANQFKEMPRVTKAQVDSKEYDVAMFGKLIPTTKIGHAGLLVGALEGKTATQVINGLIEAYVRKNPQFSKTSEWALVRTILVSISRYLESKYSVGGGLNDYHKGMLPAFLEPTTNLTLKQGNYSDGGVTGQQFTLSESTWMLQSEYFDINGLKDFIPMDRIELSREKEIDADRFFTIPMINPYIQIVSKIQLPGDIDTRTDTALKHIFYNNYDANITSPLIMGNQSFSISTEPFKYEKLDVNPVSLQARVEDTSLTSNFIMNDYLMKNPGSRRSDISVSNPVYSEYTAKTWLEKTYSATVEADVHQEGGISLFDATGSAPEELKIRSKRFPSDQYEGMPVYPYWMAVEWPNNGAGEISHPSTTKPTDNDGYNLSNDAFNMILSFLYATGMTNDGRTVRSNEYMVNVVLPWFKSKYPNGMAWHETFKEYSPNLAKGHWDAQVFQAAADVTNPLKINGEWMVSVPNHHYNVVMANQAYGSNVYWSDIFRVDIRTSGRSRSYALQTTETVTIKYQVLKLNADIHIQRANIVTNQTSLKLDPLGREKVFDKKRWGQHIRTLTPVYNNKMEFTIDAGETSRIFELSIGTVWTDYIKISIPEINATWKIPALCKDDESIGVQRILFT